MRFATLAFALACALSSILAQENANVPTDPKAQKTYREAVDYLKQRKIEAAVDGFKKANKQDGGHCLACQRKIIQYALEIRDWKSAETAASDMVADAQGDKQTARACYQLGIILMDEGLEKQRGELFSRAHEEFGKALAAYASFPDALFADGRALAHLKQDDAAKAQFEQFIKLKPETDPQRQRALRYIDQPDLARARMAPAFAVTTVDGQRVSLCKQQRSQDNS